MELASFPEANCVLDKPPGMTYEQCEAASVCRTKTLQGFPVVVSCWKVTQEELDEINRTGRVWLWIYGETMPPAAVDGMRPWPETTEGVNP